jgi:hypothetical protein
MLYEYFFPGRTRKPLNGDALYSLFLVFRVIFTFDIFSFDILSFGIFTSRYYCFRSFYFRHFYFRYIYFRHFDFRRYSGESFWRITIFLTSSPLSISVACPHWWIHILFSFLLMLKLHFVLFWIDQVTPIGKTESSTHVSYINLKNKYFFSFSYLT